MARRKKISLTDREELKRLCLADTEKFIATVAPHRLLGNIQREVLRWCNRSNAKKHQLILLPRDHGKSAIAGYIVAQEVIKDPTIRILYISSTSNLAIKQLKFIKDILTCDAVRLLWPELINQEEANREKWTEREISIDHPARKAEGIRDPTIFTAGLTSNIVGMHCDFAVLDDVVVESNAYTEDGREKVEDQYSYLSSVEGVNARELVVGTRYHPKDLYSKLQSLEVESFDELGNKTGSVPLYEVFGEDAEGNLDLRRIQVENLGDGTGEFLWPRQQRFDGKWFGFDTKILSQKRAQYINKTHFRAQYYNDPHDVESSPIQRDQFQYYDQNYLSYREGRWYFKGKRLNTFASVDFAFSLGKKADYTAIVVIGIDGDNNYYVLEIDRFRVQKPSEYFDHILKLYNKWCFRKIRAEVTGAQVVIVKDLKDSYIKPLGLSLTVDEYRPSKFIGSKEERIIASLEPKYANQQIWHYLGGNCQVLEEELIFANPPHDDCKDALAAVISADFAIPPTNFFSYAKSAMTNFKFQSKYGGVS